ncbi:hypothetical protein SEA_UPYO_21 [Gordonia phage Upyo]|nr:hypothetical protein SEA_UPYO_21 [Gordonia phage Upyo]
MTTTKVRAEDATWGDRVSQYAKTIAAAGTSAVATGATLATLLPAEQATAITAVTSVVTGFITWLTANTEILRGAADAVEDLGDVFDDPR